MRLDLFGVKYLDAHRRDGQWRLFYPGTDGKRRPAMDILIPAHITEDELVSHLEDLFHEWATPANPRIRVL